MEMLILCVDPLPQCVTEGCGTPLELLGNFASSFPHLEELGLNWNTGVIPKVEDHAATKFETLKTLAFGTAKVPHAIAWDDEPDTWEMARFLAKFLPRGAETEAGRSSWSPDVDDEEAARDAEEEASSWKRVNHFVFNIHLEFGDDED